MCQVLTPFKTTQARSPGEHRPLEVLFPPMQFSADTPREHYAQKKQGQSIPSLMHCRLTQYRRVGPWWELLSLAIVCKTQTRSHFGFQVLSQTGDLHNTSIRKPDMVTWGPHIMRSRGWHSQMHMIFHILMAECDTGSVDSGGLDVKS